MNLRERAEASLLAVIGAAGDVVNGRLTRFNSRHDAQWKARRLFPDGLEALLVYNEDPGVMTFDSYKIEANLGPFDKTLASELDYEAALGIAHALDAVFACGVYDEQGRLL